MHADHGIAQQAPVLPESTRILHVLQGASGPVSEAGTLVARAHAGRSARVGVAARPAVLRELDFLPVPGEPAGTAPATGYDAQLDLVSVSLPVRSHLSPTDPGSALDLHRLYRHVDVVHAHGLHAAALAGLATTGLPARLRPAIVATVGRFSAQSALDAAAARIVADTAATVLGTTAPVVEHFQELVPTAARAQLLSPDVSTRLEPAVSRAQVRRNLRVPDGAFLIAAPLPVTDGDELTTVLETAVRMSEHRPDRRVVFALTGSGRERGLVESAFVGRYPVVLAHEGTAVDVLAAADVVVATRSLSTLEPEALMQLARPTVVLGSERTGRLWGEATARAEAADPDALMAHISALLDSPVARVHAGFETRRRVDDVSAADFIAADLLDVYADALENRR